MVLVLKFESSSLKGSNMNIAFQLTRFIYPNIWKGYNIFLDSCTLRLMSIPIMMGNWFCLEKTTSDIIC